MAEEGGYDTNLFLNQNEANKYLCAICQHVYKEPMNINCNQEHIFCKQCLNGYFNDNSATKSCPSCRQQGLKKNDVKPGRFVERLVNSLRVKCELQFDKSIENEPPQKKRKLSSNNNNKNISNECDNDETQINICEWEGDLSDLEGHININCPLFMVDCNHCNISFRRYKLSKHIEICPEKEILCSLKCNLMIKRKLMKKHIDNKCLMKQISCNECKENILRKDMDHHILNICPEHEIYCPFKLYGCNDKIKRRLIDDHLENEEVSHLKMQVNTLESQIASQSVKIDAVNTNKILLLLKSEKAYSCCIKSKTKQQLNCTSFMNKNHHRYCIGKGISFNDARNIGFDSQDIDIFGNDIVFGTSSNNISVLCVNTKKCKSFSGNLKFRDYASIYSNTSGLLLIGGDIDEIIANNTIVNIKCNNNHFTQQTLTKLPYSAIHPSVYAINDNNNETLFVCGGWWNGRDSKRCYMYNFGNKQWKQLKNMNNRHQIAGICEWKERGNKIIVAAGYDTNEYVEEYDIDKNIWIDLPKLNKPHEICPLLLPSNNILVCISGVRSSDDNLGFIELYDPRDTANKWIYVDTVENYFNLTKDRGAAFNCFLPL